jgi:phosphonate metabolism-associated iron-containing alcohol dehydrogenase
MFHNPVRIEFGSANFAELPPLLGARSAVLITTPGTEDRGAVAALLDAIPRSDMRVFSGVHPNPTLASITAGAVEVLDPMPDLLIALGGGSALDTAKGVAAIASPGCTAPGWLSTHLRDGAPFPEGFSPLPVIAIPTTAGTGSEVTSWGTVWDEQDGSKHSISHPLLFPEAALLIPDLTLTAPAELTLVTGLDSISHCMESVWNRRATVISDAFAVAGLQKIFSSLTDVLDNLGDLDARRTMQAGSLFGGLAISSNATALGHSMSYPLTSRFGMPHGLACSFTLPELIRFNGEYDAGRVGLIVEVMGAADVSDAAARLEALFDGWEVPAHVRRYLTPEKVDKVKDLLIAPGRASNNLRPASPDDALGIIRRAMT